MSRNVHGSTPQRVATLALGGTVARSNPGCPMTEKACESASCDAARPGCVSNHVNQRGTSTRKNPPSTARWPSRASALRTSPRLSRPPTRYREIAMRAGGAERGARAWWLTAWRRPSRDHAAKLRLRILESAGIGRGERAESCRHALEPRPTRSSCRDARRSPQLSAAFPCPSSASGQHGADFALEPCEGTPSAKGSHVRREGDSAGAWRNGITGVGAIRELKARKLRHQVGTGPEGISRQVANIKICSASALLRSTRPSSSA